MTMHLNKLSLIFLLCLPALFARAQSDFIKADSFALHFKQPYSDAADLAKKLTVGFSTEREKTRVIFMWIADNIGYDCKKFHNPDDNRFSWRTEAEKQQKIKQMQQDQIKSTLKNKRGVCADYSQLFCG